MSSTFNQVLLHFHDQNMEEAGNFWTTADQTDSVPAGLITLATKVQACSRAALVAVQWQTTHYFTATPSALPFGNRRDRCHMLGTVGTSEYPHYDLIAPKDDIFLADGRTLNLADSRVSQMTAAMQAVLGNPEGAALTQIRRGRRQWSG